MVSTPLEVSKPVAAVSAAGVASENAHGQVMTKTDSAIQKARSGWVCCQNKNTPIAVSKISGTKREATFSASRASSGFSACARSNKRIIAAKTVLSPTFSTWKMSGLSILTVPPTTLSPICFGQGKLSPVSNDSLVLLIPSIMTPSAGTISPGLTST